MGVRLPAEVRRLPKPHRTLVEDPPVPGARRAWEQIEDAIEKAKDYWNAHRRPYVWGRRRRHRAARRPGVGAMPTIPAGG